MMRFFLQDEQPRHKKGPSRETLGVFYLQFDQIIVYRGFFRYHKIPSRLILPNFRDVRQKGGGLPEERFIGHRLPGLRISLDIREPRE